MKLIAENHKARFDFEIIEEVEVGIILKGTEVKSLRVSSPNFSGAYCRETGNAIWLDNLRIDEYKFAYRVNHSPKASRKLLLHKKQIRKLIGTLRSSKLTIVPTAIYFNNNGIIKVKIALARGKSKCDKRQTIKQREWLRKKSTIS